MKHTNPYSFYKMLPEILFMAILTYHATVIEDYSLAAIISILKTQMNSAIFIVNIIEFAVFIYMMLMRLKIINKYSFGSETVDKERYRLTVLDILRYMGYTYTFCMCNIIGLGEILWLFNIMNCFIIYTVYDQYKSEIRLGKIIKEEGK